MFPKIGWIEISPEVALQLDCNPNFRWAMWRMEWFGYGVGLKVKQLGPRQEPEVAKPKRKAKK